jgi:fucose permease
MNTEAAKHDSARLVRWLTCLMFFTFAMTTDAVGSVIPRIIAEYRLSMTAAGAFQYATMLGIAAGALLLGFLADRIGRQRTIILGLALYGASSLLVAVFGHFPMLVALLAVSGLGISIFKTAALALMGDITTSSQAHTRFMNTVEGFFAVGAIAGPAIVTVLIGANVSWKWSLLRSVWDWWQWPAQFARRFRAKWRSAPVRRRCLPSCGIRWRLASPG